MPEKPEPKQDKPPGQPKAPEPETANRVEEPAEPPKKISLKSGNKRTSGLSLKSIKAKKEHEIKQMDVVVEEEELPKEPVSQEQLTKAWNSYAEALKNKGRHNLASILSIDEPKLEGTDIQLTFPNETNKLELERDQFELLGHLRKTLKNYDLALDITVNEAVEKKLVYSKHDKYQKLLEKNPTLDLLRKTFHLDL